MAIAEKYEPEKVQKLGVLNFSISLVLVANSIISADRATGLRASTVA